jgi:hypothetical protein
MNIYFKLLAIVMSLGGVFFLSSAIIYYLKFLNKKHHLGWSILDYISVGYMDHIVNRYIKRI